MKKEQKVSSIDLAKNIFDNHSVVVLLNYKKLNAKGMGSLRKALKDKKANLKILKNTLIRRAALDSNFKSLVDDFKDQIAISYSNDPVSLSNVLVNFANDNESVELKAGFMDGQVIGLDIIKHLSSLGSIEDVRAKFIGLLKAPGSKIARILVAHETKLNENAGN